MGRGEGAKNKTKQNKNTIKLSPQRGRKGGESGEKKHTQRARGGWGWGWNPGPTTC